MFKSIYDTHPGHQTSFMNFLPPSIAIHCILLVKFTCLTVLFHNLSVGPLWSSSRSRTPCFILHTFLYPIIFFLQHMSIPSQRQVSSFYFGGYPNFLITQRKMNQMGSPSIENQIDPVCLLDRTPACHRQTDGQTDRHRTIVCTALRSVECMHNAEKS